MRAALKSLPRVYPCGSGRFLSRSPNDRPGTEDITRRPGAWRESSLSTLQAQGESFSNTAFAIFQTNRKLIDSCQALLANVLAPFRGPSADVGTAWEIGYACGQGKPVVAYAEDLSVYRDKVFRSGWSESSNEARDRHGNEIEDFGGIDNLMITQSVIEICPTFEEAATALKRFLDQ